jgi:hypothetical protein
MYSPLKERFAISRIILMKMQILKVFKVYKSRTNLGFFWLACCEVEIIDKMPTTIK